MAFQGMSRHPAHPQHDLSLVDKRSIFRCNLCNEEGVNWRYECANPTSRCNFHLHRACGDAANPDLHEIKPAIYEERHTFDFRMEPVNDSRCCVACGRPITGYNYHCDHKNLDLHPGCTTEFPEEITVQLQLSSQFPTTNEVRLQLLKGRTKKFPKEIRALNVKLKLRKRLNGQCQHCDSSSYQGGSEYLNPWAYVSECGTYQYFAGCVRDAGFMVYAAQAQAITGPNESTHVHLIHYYPAPGGGHKVLPVSVSSGDFFNQFVSAFTSAFAVVPV